MNGIVILNKPIGISSNTACRKVGKILGEKKVGHLGTLDVLASGVLPVTLGRCTRLFDYFLKKDKTYLATFAFGYETTTLDSEGEIVKRNEVQVDVERVKQELENFLGVQNQMPPQYSAKKINGKCAYELARQNVEVVLKPKEIQIFKFELVKKLENNVFQFEITCSAGTYIRALARDLANALGTFGTMTALVRLRAGNFEIQNSFDFEQIQQKQELVVLNYDDIFNGNSILQVDLEQTKKLQNGMTIRFCANDGDEYVVKFENTTLGIGTVENDFLKLKLHLQEKIC